MLLFFYCGETNVEILVVHLLWRKFQRQIRLSVVKRKCKIELLLVLIIAECVGFSGY